MRMSGRHIAAPALAGLIVISLSSVEVGAWGAQGHRLVALVAAARLTPTARSNVRWLLDPQTQGQLRFTTAELRAAFG